MGRLAYRRDGGGRKVDSGPAIPKESPRQRSWAICIPIFTRSGYSATHPISKGRKSEALRFDPGAITKVAKSSCWSYSCSIVDKGL
jgi:hypothetical protein